MEGNWKSPLIGVMLDQGRNHERINWGRLLLTIDLAVTQIVNGANFARKTGKRDNTKPGLFLVASRTGRVRNFTSYKNHGQSRLSSHPRQFGNARWLESWSRRSSQDMVMPGLPDIEMAMQSCSIVIRKGKLSIRVRRPGGKFRLIGIPPQPTSWHGSALVSLTPILTFFPQAGMLRTRSLQVGLLFSRRA